ncbi:uncharacterized protein C8R40DRAFT_1074901 [Lentinula edodes]|uniref:uncharacterized protein n=1 Tax=Lentinula edodes TaxID=5353 RepID=UPI001E8CC32B|nr:uncharacterized protein C8R40DRAFT_1074901 [Lentinula edodes]KAH7868295.1 hypothetical protein C8R40DRAFT_1074901 [Lentinula edodes]
MGTTKGCALILEVKHAEKLQALKHGNDQTWVTSLAYINIDSRYRMIATGDGNREQRTRIILWIEEDEKDISFKFPKLWYIMPKLNWAGSLYLDGIDLRFIIVVFAFVVRSYVGEVFSVLLQIISFWGTVRFSISCDTCCCIVTYFDKSHQTVRRLGRVTSACQ